MVAFFNTSSINCWNVAATCEHNGHWTDATPGQLWRPSFHDLLVLTPLASSHDKSLKCWTKRPQPEHQACHQPEAMNGKDQGLQPSSLYHPPGVAPIYPFFLCLSGEVLCARLCNRQVVTSQDKMVDSIWNRCSTSCRVEHCLMRCQQSPKTLLLIPRQWGTTCIWQDSIHLSKTQQLWRNAHVIDINMMTDSQVQPRVQLQFNSISIYLFINQSINQSIVVKIRLHR